MTPEDRARAAERLLDDPLVVELLMTIEAEAINAMLKAETDEGRREGRDKVNTIRALRRGLTVQGSLLKEQNKIRPGVV